MSSESPGPELRRIVTGHDQDGVAQVMTDGPATNAKQSGSGAVSTLMWCTDGAPANIPIGADFEDMGARIVGTQPPALGSRFCVIEFPAGAPTGMHRTESIDYVICLAGEIDMDMDNSTVTMKTGDVMVQRGTNHAWVNRSDAPARVAFILLDADPLGIGAPIEAGAHVLSPKQ
jgi:quercetin dioxygenase-like cupin family protein